MALALSSSQVMALGLGQLQVKSGLNQPLVAEIPIFAAMPGEVDSLNVRLASPEAFERVGLTRPGYLTANLSFSVGKNARGQNVVLVTSTGKFVEPFLSFLIEADWGRGSVTKEYTALIDPPYIAKAIVRPMEAPTVAVAPAQVVPPPELTLPPIVLKPEPEPAPPPVIADQAAPLIFEPAPEPTPVAPAPVASEEPAPAVADAALPPPPADLPPATPLPIAPEPAATNTGAYGPVDSGKTLWSIAEEVRPDPSVTIKQMMLALLRANPEAFDGENINKLKRGSVLRIPGREEASILSDEQAAALVAEQSANLRAQRQPVPQPSETVAENSPLPSDVPAVPEVSEAPKPLITPAKPKPVVAKVSKPKARLEITPPSGKTTAAKATQSGAAAAGGTELRAELSQAREDIAVRDSEISDLKSRLTDLESQQADTQKLIAMKDSRLKELQDELEKQNKAAPLVKPAPAVAANTDTPAAIVAPDPWYMNPMLHYGAGGLLLLGGLVWFLRRNKNKSEDDEPVVSRRISDDVDLQASLSSLQAANSVHQDKTAPGKAVNIDNNTQVHATAPKPAPAAKKEEPELVGLRKAVRAKPQDLEAHLSLLRYYYTRGESKDFEATAQTMRTHVSSAQDPRWREAVVMGVALLPGHALFSQAGWNSPKFETSPKEIPVAIAAAPAPTPAPAAEEPSFLSPQDMDELDNLEAVSIVGAGVQETAAPSVETADEIMLMSESDFVALDNMPDIHRSESELMDIDAASSTKIELARAYLEIGDVEGARSMLEEVASSGSAPAKAMAQRIIGELG
jgi:pilus assembly protein FimV